MPRLLAVAAVAAALLAAAPRAHAANIGEKCNDDRECAVGSICSNESVCVALPRKKSIIPFYFHQPGDSGYRHVIPLGYFHTWDKHKDTRVQVPFFGWRKNYDTGETTSVVPLLFSSYTTSSDAKLFRIWPFVFMGTYKSGGGQAAMLPLFWWSKHEGHSWFVAPLLLSGGQRDEQKDITEAVIGLVGYYRRHADISRWGIVFPLVWDHKTPEAHTTVAPLFWHRTRPDGHSATVVFPLFWHVHDDKAGYDHSLFIPLFDWEQEQRGHKQRFVSLIAAWQKDDSINLRQFLFYAPIIFHRSDNKRVVDVVPPLFTRWYTRDSGASGIIAGPFFSAGDRDGSTTALFPIYWRFHDNQPDASTHVLFPIAAFHHHPGARGGFVGPIYGWSSSNGEGGWGGGVAPIFMFGRSGARRHALVLPVFAHWSDARAATSTTAIGPLYVHKNADSTNVGLLPLLFFGKTRGGGYGAVGPIYGLRDDSGWAGGVAPLAFFGNRDGRSHQVIVPLVWRFADARAHTDRLLVGPYYHGRDHDRTEDALFPLFYVTRTPKSAFGIWPIGAWRKANGVNTVVVGPFGYQSKEATHSRTAMLFPLLTVHDSPRYSVRVLFPFIWRIRDGEETDTAIFPIYFRGRSPERGWDGVFPLFIHHYDKIGSTTLVGPIWYRGRKDGGKSAGLFPVFAWGKKQGPEGKSSSWFGMPGVYADSNDWTGRSHVWAINFFRFGQPEGYTAGLIPLAFAWRRGTASKVLTPIYYRQADRARDYSLDVFTLLFWGHEGKSWRAGLFPLFLAAHDADGGWRSGLFPLYWASKRADGGSTFATLLGGYSSSAGGKRVYVGPFYYRNDAETRSGALIPIAYFGKNKVLGTSTSYIFPLYLDVRRSEDRQLAAYTPLVWRYHNVESTTTIGLPLFFDVNRVHESRTTGLLPLFVRNRSEVERDTSYAIPPILTWWRTRDDHSKSDAVVFPLIWHFGGQSSTTVVAPLVWDFKRGESRTTVVFPLGARWKRPDGIHTIALNVYYGKGLGPKEGAWNFRFFPLISFGRPRKHDVEWYFLEGLFGYSRLGRNRNLRLLWVLDFALEPVPASNLSWFGSTPTQARELF
jgi:hypothetical protein